MAIKIESAYSKTIGLPNYSSHKFHLCLTTEVTDLSQVAAEAEKVYRILQTAVDKEMAQPGFVPNGQGDSKPGQAAAPRPAPAHGAGSTSTSNGAHQPSQAQSWACSPKQQSLIEDLAQRNNVEIAVFADLAQKRFGKELSQLNKLEASGLIDELLDRYAERKPASGRRQANRQYAGNGRGT
jgi:hypothetical protein